MWLKQIRRLLVAPEFDDAELTQSAQLVHGILLVLFPMWLCLLVAGLLSGHVEWRQLFLLVLLAGSCVWLVLLDRGQVRLAIVSIIALTWAGGTLMFALRGGVRAPGCSSFIAISLFAGLTLGARPCLVVTGLCTCSLLGMLGLELAGITQYQPVPPGFAAMLHAVSLVSSALMVIWYIRQMRKAQAQAQESERALQLKNRELELEIERRKAHEAELLKHQQLLEWTQELARIGYWEYDLQRGHGSWSPLVYEFFQRHPDQGLPPARELKEHIHPEDLPLLTAHQEQMVAGQMSEVEFRLQNPGQHTRYIHLRSNQHPSGVDGEYFGILWDITEHKQQQLLLEYHAKALEQKNKELRELVYITTHDLQEPLRTLRSFSRLLHRDYSEALDPRAAKYIHFMTHASERMSVLVGALLEYARIGNHKARPTTVDCAALFAHLQEDLELALCEANATLKVSEMPKIQGFEAELRSLFQNLLTNALKFRKEEVAPVVEIGVEATREGWLFSVSDNGIGVAPEYHEKIFAIFRRLHHSDEYEGLGIGLAHCQKIVDLHGGRIWLESEPGKGSTFFVLLPQAPRGSEDGLPMLL